MMCRPANLLRRAAVRLRQDAGATAVEYIVILGALAVPLSLAAERVHDSGSDRLDDRTASIGNPDYETIDFSTGSYTPPDPGSGTNDSSDATETRVSDLSATTSTDGSNWVATVTVTVVDQDGDPLAGVTVEGNWLQATSATTSCTTGDQGTCVVTQWDMKRSGASAITNTTFSVATLTHETLPYNAAASSPLFIDITAP